MADNIIAANKVGHSSSYTTGALIGYIMQRTTNTWMRLAHDARVEPSFNILAPYHCLIELRAYLTYHQGGQSALLRHRRMRLLQ